MFDIAERGNGSIPRRSVSREDKGTNAKNPAQDVWATFFPPRSSVLPS